MEIDFNTVLKDLDDKDIKRNIYSGDYDAYGNPVKTGDEILTLGMVCRDSLVNLTGDELKLPGDKKDDRYHLAGKIRKSEKEEKPINLKSEDITLLKELIGVKYMPLIIGDAWKILDPQKESE